MQVTAYYAPQFEALREIVVEGGHPVFTACLSRCKKWLSRGGKSAVYFAKTRDERYVVKQLTRSEKQSFLDFAPAYFRCPSLSFTVTDALMKYGSMLLCHVPCRPCFCSVTGPKPISVP